MKNKIFAASTLCVALLLSGCGTGTPAETSAVTEEATTTAASEVTTAASTTTSSTTTAVTEDYTKPREYNSLSDAAEVVSEYDFENGITPLLDKYHITYSDDDYCGYMRIGEYAVLEENSPDTEENFPVWGGLTLLSETGEYHIGRDDLPAFGGQYYYIYKNDRGDDCLGIYEDRTDNGYHVLSIYEVLIKESFFDRLNWYVEKITDANGKWVGGNNYCESFPSFTGEYGAYSFIAEKSRGKVYTTAYEMSWNGVDCKKPSWEMRIYKNRSETGGSDNYESVYYSAKVPDEAEQSRIFEEAFYGIWESADGGRTVDLTYGDAELNYENPPYALAENDEAYFLFSAPGGELRGFVVLKSEPDSIYISPQFGNAAIESTYYGWYANYGSPEFTRRSDSPAPDFGLGEINVFGQMKVNGILGEKFAECLRQYTEDNRRYDDSWVLAGGLPSPNEEHILVELSDNKAVIALKYMYIPDYEEWMKNFYTNDIRMLYIAYTFEKGENGGWTVTAGEPYSAITSRTTGVFTITDDRDKLEYYEENGERSRAALKPGDKLGDGKLTVTAAREDNAGPGRFVYCTGEVTLKGLIRRVQETPEFETEQKGDLFFYPFPESLGDLPLILDSTYWRVFGQDDKDYYFIADTPCIFLGNNEKKETYTKLPDNRYGHMAPINVEYCDKLGAFTGDFYIAEITFSDLYLIYYPCIMSGSPNSVVNIESIGEYAPVTFEELAGMFGETGENNE
jgi:hypothetical protein